MHPIHTQVVVVGGGPAGICGALAAARSGCKTLLVHNRPVLGVNSSSEIRVWSRGAVGAGNFYGEEMGIWGELKLSGLYRNPEGNPVFWDEVLLDAVLAEPNLTVLLNTDVYALEQEGQKIECLKALQQGTEQEYRICAEVYIDATGDGTLGYLAGVPYYYGDAYISDGSVPRHPEVLGCSLLFYTRKEEQPVRFVAPEYAYDMEKVAGLIDRGGRIVSEKMGGSDCWWFEYGGCMDTISQLQDIAIELKRLVMGVWNYIKNSGRYPAENYTLEWVGNIPGKRESRRMETEYILTEADVRQSRSFPDGAFFGGWYMDSHPAGGIHDTAEDSCVQVPVNVYPVPFRCLYSRWVPNLLFAGRNIGTERQAFVSSRVMNTCALSGQAAGQLAEAMVRLGKTPEEMQEGEIRQVQQALFRNDMFIPGLTPEYGKSLEAKAEITASSHHLGDSGEESGELSVEKESFVSFPGSRENPWLTVNASKSGVLKGTAYVSPLPNRFCPGEPVGELELALEPGRQEVELKLPEKAREGFCTIYFADNPDAAIVCVKPQRVGFLCGRRESPQYWEPRLAYREDVGLYEPQQALTQDNRPWVKPNLWMAAPEDEKPWICLTWEQPERIREIRLFLDPSLNEELPSTRARYWQKSHHFISRTGMPASLIKTGRVQVQTAQGSWQEIAEFRENYQRLLVLTLPEEVKTRQLRLVVEGTWGGPPAIYHIGLC